MREIVISAVFVLIMVCGLDAFAGVSAGGYEEAAGQGTRDTVQSDVEQTLKNAREAYDEMGKVTYEKTIPKPEDIQRAANDCLSGIMKADFGFGLSVPSVSSLFNAACSSINSEVKSHLDAADFELSDQYTRIGAGLGGNSAPANRIDYDQIGDEIANDLWNDMTEDNKW